jgi:sugar lactone lactonase YvrE
MMRPYALKSPLFFASLLLAMACFISACSKRSDLPTSRNYEKSDTTVNPGDTSANGQPLATFNEPTGVAVDAAGNIYVADYGNNMIRKITPAGVVTTLAGNGTQGSLNGPDSLSSFNGPTSVAVDQSGNVYVADDNNNQIRVIANGMVNTLAGSDSTGAVDGQGPLAYFFGPSSVSCDAQGNVYVADAGNNLIRMVTPGGLVSTIAGQINPGAQNGPDSSATFNNPAGIAVDGSGNIYVADMLNDLIRKISGGQVSTLAGSLNDTTVASINGVGTAASFVFPNSVAVDASGNVYTTEYVTNLIRKITPDGTVTTLAGSGASGQADSTGTAASFSGPSGVAVDASGNVYVADTYNNVIRKITPAGVVSTIAGSGVAGSTNGAAVSGLRKVKNLHALAMHKRIRPNNNVLFRILVKKATMRMRYMMRLYR